jgi:hypothetical protein
MGADAPIPPLVINAAAPDGAPPQRINNGYTFGKNSYQDGVETFNISALPD